jgi:hypothetical protein
VRVCEPHNSGVTCPEYPMELAKAQKLCHL